VSRTAIEEEADTVVDRDTLLHGEALLVVATSNAEDVALEVITKGVTGNLLRDALIVEEAAKRRW